jgi:Coenzyme PQQ synthesis protein D (PqqD)
VGAFSGETLSRATLRGTEGFRQNERTACRVIDGKAVVITIDENQVHVLNAVGTRVWQLADGRSLDTIIDEIVVEFEVERERAALDVCSFAAQLVALGAAHVDGGRG